MSDTARAKVLDAAKQAVCGDRDVQYGKPEDTFGVISNLWRAYLSGRDLLKVDMNNTLTAHDVAMMMALLKVGRIVGGSEHPDNYIDLAGYAACAGELAGFSVDWPEMDKEEEADE